MKRRSFPWAIVLVIGLLLPMAVVLTVPSVTAQTTSITNLKYPTAPVQGGDVRVTFDVTYSSFSSADILVAGLFDQASKDYASGTGSSSPDRCIPTAEFSGKTVCFWLFKSSSGTEHVTFDLQFSTHRATYSLAAIAGVGTTSGNVIYSSLSAQRFSITIGGEVQLTVNTQPAVPVSVDGAQAGKGTTSILVEPGTHSVSVPGVVPIDDLNQLKFENWDDGSNTPTRSVDVESDTTLTATYVEQHKLVLISPVNATGAGWYDDGSAAHYSVPASAPLEGAVGMLGGRLQFKGWYENGKLVTQPSAGVIQMNEAHTLIAEWQPDYTIPIAIIGGLIALIVVGVVLSLRRGKPRRRR